MGFDQQTLDEAARVGFANGAFEESIEDAGAVVEEFYPAEISEEAGEREDPSSKAKGSAALRNKLEAKL